MTSLNLASSHPEHPELGAYSAENLSEHPLLRVVSVASLVIGATALGLYVGRELRQRYKFKRRTPYDFYANAGDPVALTEYGMGI